jgi:arylsulfatase A-like enzyme
VSDESYTPLPSVSRARREAERIDWFDRHVVVSGALGLGIGVVGQLCVAWLARGEIDATRWQSLAGVLYALALWLTAGLLCAAVGCRLLHVRGGRVAALLVSSLVLGALAITSAFGTALRVVSGSYLTAGAVMFSLNSSEHFLHGFSSGYAGYAAIIAALALAFGAGVALALRPAAVRRCWPAQRHSAALGVLSVVLALVYANREAHGFTKGMFVSEPLLVLAGSLAEGDGFEMSRISERPDALGEPLAPPGPPRSAEAEWLAAVRAHQGPRPNVILVMLESVAPRHLSGFGYARPTTPTIDAIARSGLNLRRAWTTATHSNYAQMAVLSSLFPRRGHGLDEYRRLDYPRVLFHDVFFALGYDTATITSQDENWQGMKRFQQTGTPTFFWHSDDYTGAHLDSGVERTVPDDDTTDVALGWLAKKRDKPWALYVNFQATHFPYTISAKAERRYQPDEPTWSTFGYLGFPEAEKQIVINRYDNALEHVDDQVRRLRDHFAATGELDDTLWVITSDHGEMFFEKGLVTHGKTLYEIEARVPLIFSWPGHIEPEERLDPASSLDMMPTLLGYLGLPPHPSWQGKSHVAAATAGDAPAPVYINIQGLRFADALVCWPWKLILDRTGKRPFLFNLADDPDELTNLVETEEEIAARLNDALTKQLIAQLDYHSEETDVREREYQPRLRKCPRLD